MSTPSSSSRTWLSTGSSSWKNDSCMPAVLVCPAGLILAFPRLLGLAVAAGSALSAELPFSSCASTSSARRTIDAGMPHEFGHMYAEAVLASASGELAQEHYLAVDFLYRHVVVDDAAVGALHVVQFVVVGCKECLGVRGAVFVYMLYDGTLSICRRR